MNKNTVKLFILALALGGSITAFAQTPEQRDKIAKHTDTATLKSLSEKLGAEYAAKRAEALRLAELNGWPVEIETENGGLKTLVEISSEGKPLYLTTHNEGVAITSRVNHLQPEGSLGLNLTGQNMYVGMWDGNYPRNTHVDFAGRFIPNDGATTPQSFHPTHVLGTMIGAGAQNSEARGMAYEAYAIVNNYDDDLTEMSSQAGTIVLSNHSYGLDVSQVPTYYLGAYVQQSKLVDDIMFAAPYYQPVFSAGNDGNGNYDRLTDRTTSKNGIAVAAVLEVQEYSGWESVTLAGFSSWGPTDDKRIKPDIATKGVSVLSASNASNTSYGFSQGTSMSAPGITGALLLLQQYYSQLHPSEDPNIPPFMRSATLRALMAHTADECGPTDGPDAKFGWGLLNAKRGAEIITNEGETSIMNEEVLLPNQPYTLNVLSLGSEPLIATLAWTDPSGDINPGIVNLSDPVLVNDLDIVVKRTSDNQANYPWRLNSNPDLGAVKGVNSVDNIEKVEVNSPGATWYTITINHKGNTLINPGTGASPSQAFSLIVSGVNAGMVSRDEFENAGLFSVWPNPAKDVLNVTMATGVEQNSAAYIYDTQGRLVLQHKISDMESSINTESLSVGIYIIKIQNGSKTEVKKFIIK